MKLKNQSWIVLGVFLTTLEMAHAEQVKCKSADAKDDATVNVALKHSPGMPVQTDMLSATVKSKSRYVHTSYLIRRKQKGNDVLYREAIDPTLFVLSVHSKEVGGENLPADLVMDQGRWFEQKISGLLCTISGAPTPPVLPCPEAQFLDSKLIEAAQYGSADQLDHLLNCGAKVNFKDKKGCTALLYVSDLACGYSTTGMISHPADPTAGAAPILSTRSSLALDTLMDVLIDYGANVESTDPVNLETPLLKLTKYGSVSGVEKILDRVPDVDAQDKHGNTALMIAVSRGSELLVRTIMNSEPDITIKNKLGKTAYAIAEEKGFYDLLPLLILPEATYTIQGKADGTCEPTMVHISKDKPVEIVLKASAGMMFKLEAPDLDIDLMAMSGGSAKKIITPTQSGTFPFTCGVHGSSQQTKGSFMVM